MEGVVEGEGGSPWPSPPHWKDQALPTSSPPALGWCGGARGWCGGARGWCESRVSTVWATVWAPLRGGAGPQARPLPCPLPCPWPVGPVEGRGQPREGCWGAGAGLVNRNAWYRVTASLAPTRASSTSWALSGRGGGALVVVLAAKKAVVLAVVLAPRPPV